MVAEKRKALPGDLVTAEKVCPLCGNTLWWGGINGTITWWCNPHGSTPSCGKIRDIWIGMATKSKEMAERLDGHYYKARLCHDRYRMEMKARRLGIKVY